MNNSTKTDRIELFTMMFITAALIGSIVQYQQQTRIQHLLQNQKRQMKHYKLKVKKALQDQVQNYFQTIIH